MNFELLYTTVPDDIHKIHYTHACASADIQQWLNRIRCKTSWEFYKTRDELVERMLSVTAIDIQFRHVNDYVECGPGYDDEERNMFYIISLLKIEPEFEAKDFEHVTHQLKQFSNHKSNMNGLIPHVCLDFYSWLRKLSAARHDNMLTYDLTFKIYHNFNK